MQNFVSSGSKTTAYKIQVGNKHFV